MFGGNFWFYAAPGVQILGDHDCAFDRNAQAVELFVVFGQAVIYEDEWSGYVAIDRISVVGGQLLRLLI